MKETSQSIPPAPHKLGKAGDIIPANPARFDQLSPDTRPEIPDDVKGYLALSKNAGDILHYQPMFEFSTDSADALPTYPVKLD